MYRVFYQSADADPVPLCSVFDLILEFEDSHLPPLTDDRPDDASVLPHGNGFEVATASDASILESLPMHFHNLVRGAVLADVRPCGHHDCGCSTTIAGCLSFGRGALDELGFWEIGCAVCARAHEGADADKRPCWPLTDAEAAKWRTAFEILKPVADGPGEAAEEVSNG